MGGGGSIHLSLNGISWFMSLVLSGRYDTVIYVPRVVGSLWYRDLCPSCCRVVMIPWFMSLVLSGRYDTVIYVPRVVGSLRYRDLCPSCCRVVTILWFMSLVLSGRYDTVIYVPRVVGSLRYHRHNYILPRKLTWIEVNWSLSSV